MSIFRPKYLQKGEKRGIYSNQSVLYRSSEKNFETHFGGSCQEKTLEGSAALTFGTESVAWVITVAVVTNDLTIFVAQEFDCKNDKANADPQNTFKNIFS